MDRFEGRSSYTTTIPGKPTPTGFKIWAIAQGGFQYTWNFHTPGAKNGPINTRTPVELGGSKKQGNGGNKTQAVALKLCEQLPGTGYHVFFDNLFTSLKFFELLRARGFGATGTCRTNSGVIQELVTLKNDDKKDVIPWGSKFAFPSPSNKVLQMGWKDNAFCLAMTTVISQDAMIVRNRKRPKLTSSKAKTARVPFGELARKDLEIPLLFDEYNHHMGSVDQGDQLFSVYPGLRPIRRGGGQALEHWLLVTVLVNTYLIARHSPPSETTSINFRSQRDFRLKLVQSLLVLGKELSRLSRKRSIAHMSTKAIASPVSSHTMVKMKSRRQCAACKGLRHSDRPQKRIALSAIAGNEGRPSTYNKTLFGCKECDVWLCSIRDCWSIFHGFGGAGGGGAPL